MKQRDHRIITKSVAEILAPGVNLAMLTTASGEHPDLFREGSSSHHSWGNFKQVFSRIRKARQEYLRHGYSVGFKNSLGYAFHYIQDLFVIATPHRHLRGSLLALHNMIESKFSTYTNSIAYEGISSETLEGEGAVKSFLKTNVEIVSKDPEYALAHPIETLERCFRVCLSIGYAVCNNAEGFPKGEEAETLCDEVAQRMEQMKGQVDRIPGLVENIVSKTDWLLDQTNKAYQWRRRSFLLKVISVFRLDTRHHRAEIAKRKRLSEARFGKILRILLEVENWGDEVSKRFTMLERILESGYEQDYEIRQSNAAWYRFESDRYKTSRKLWSQIEIKRKELGQIKEEVERLKMIIQKERERIRP